jgi:hypothetical protein
MVACCECGFDGASKWHWQMHQWVEQHRCTFRFGCRNIACSSLHTLAEQAHKCTRQRLGQREWEAECGFCSVGLCKYGSACERTSRTVAYDHDCDSNYEDDEDGWSVVGGDSQCAVWADRAKPVDRAGAMGGGRYELLVCEDEPDDGFFECDCDNAEFRFELRKERRTRQQERRKQGGQHRKGRTARKRVQAAVQFRAAAVGSHGVHKRVCWLRAKMALANNKWRCYIWERDAVSVAGDGYRDAPFGRAGLLQAREDEKLEWRQAIQDTLDGRAVQPVNWRWREWSSSRRTGENGTEHSSSGHNGIMGKYRVQYADYQGLRGANSQCG